MEVAKSAFTASRTRTTLSLSVLKDKVQRQEMGRRIRDLRIRSGWKQKMVAKKLGKTERMYQKYEKEGTGDFEIVEKLARIHWRAWGRHDPEWAYLSAGWIWDGKDRRQTPDVFQSLNGSSQEQLDRIEAKLDEILKNWDARWALLEATDVGPESDQAEQQPARESRATRR